MKPLLPCRETMWSKSSAKFSGWCCFPTWALPAMEQRLKWRLLPDSGLPSKHDFHHKDIRHKLLFFHSQNPFSTNMWKSECKECISHSMDTWRTQVNEKELNCLACVCAFQTNALAANMKESIRSRRPPHGHSRVPLEKVFHNKSP